MEIYVETVSVGTWVKARIVLRSGRSDTELARLSLTPAQWDDVARCLSHVPRVKQGRIVFTPGPRGGDARNQGELSHCSEAVA